MGDTYAGRDDELQRPIALKVLRSAGGAPDLFLQEARAASALHHPHIVMAHEVVTLGPVIAARVLRAAMGTQSAQALAAAHAAGFPHTALQWHPLATLGLDQA